jgi:hypothetical protein
MVGEKSMRKLIVLSIIATLFLAGCSSSVKELEITTKPIEKPELVVPSIGTLSLKDVEWFVINEKNVDEVWKRLSDDKKDIVLFGLTDDGYESLAINFSDIMTLIQEQKAIIGAYQEYYEGAEAEAKTQAEALKAKEEEKKWWQIK